MSLAILKIDVILESFRRFDKKYVASAKHGDRQYLTQPRIKQLLTLVDDSFYFYFTIIKFIINNHNFSLLNSVCR